MKKKTDSPIVGVAQSPVFVVADTLTDAIIAVCDQHNLVCSVEIVIQHRDGRKVLTISGHGEHELQ